MQSQSQNLEASMAEKAAREKKGGSISEEDVAVVLQRYRATVVLDLLREVSQFQDVKIDWNTLVKRTKTGIKNPREYQMLWRHLAYREPLIDLEDDAEPVDEDSDLEYELEAFPTVSNEASAEAAACVKVLIDSGSSSESCLEKGLTIEGPLTINIPKDKSSDHPSEVGSWTSGMNITVPVCVPKQALPTVSSAEGLDTSGCANNNLPARKKRKPWSPDEDKELLAAVQKCGEGNWANILKGDFKGDRTASQLSQRWNLIKKRKTTSNIRTGSQLSEVQLAARQALNMALDKPGLDNRKVASSLGMTNPGNISVQPTVAEPSSAGSLQQNPSQQDSAATGAKRAPPRTQPFSTRPSLKPLASGADAVKAAAVAAGARIATQSAAAAILKAANFKHAIHIKTTSNANSRPLPVASAHMGSDYFRDRYSSISPNTSRPNLGSAHANASVGPLAECNTGPDANVSSETSDGLEVKPSGSANSPVQEDQVGVCGDSERDVVQDDQVTGLGSKDEDEEEQPPAGSKPPSSNLESE